MLRELKAAVVLAGAIGVLAACQSTRHRTPSVNDLLAKDDMTVAVTDSGLGGLSVAADVAARLPVGRSFRKVRLVFFNALFHEKGYNNLRTEEDKVRILSTVLDAMSQSFKPDLLLIACNTLSVIYDKTAFARTAPFPVVGIVETGGDVIAEQLRRTHGATVIVFGTKTTIESGAHRDLLVGKGFSPDQIVGQACHRLAGAIERGVESDETRGYVRQFVGEALAKIPRAGAPLMGSFNCTHFGYARRQFEDAFRAAGYPDVVLLDPNPRMADVLFRPPFHARFPRTDVTVEVVSMLEISAAKIRSIGPFLRAVSPTTADAFASYTFDPLLVEVQYDFPPDS